VRASALGLMLPALFSRFDSTGTNEEYAKMLLVATMLYSACTEGAAKSYRLLQVYAAKQYGHPVLQDFKPSRSDGRVYKFPVGTVITRELI
jgi:hypothetical protein